MTSVGKAFATGRRYVYLNCTEFAYPPVSYNLKRQNVAKREWPMLESGSPEGCSTGNAELHIGIRPGMLLPAPNAPHTHPNPHPTSSSLVSYSGSTLNAMHTIKPSLTPSTRMSLRPLPDSHRHLFTCNSLERLSHTNLSDRESSRVCRASALGWHQSL